MDNKPNCYNCIYRGEVPGSRHSCCNHPANGPILTNPMAHIFGILGSVGRGPGINMPGPGLHVKGNHHGIFRGWFNFPINFDPTWLESCDGFKEKADHEKE